MYENSAGIVTNERAKLHCCVCGNSFCSHCGEIRRKRGNENREENPGFLNEFLDVSYSPSTERNIKPKSTFKIPFYPDERMERNLRIPPSSYLPTEDSPTKDSPTEDSLYICEEETYCCSELATGIIIRRVKLYTKNTYYECVGKLPNFNQIHSYRVHHKEV